MHLCKLLCHVWAELICTASCSQHKYARLLWLYRPAYLYPPPGLSSFFTLSPSAPVCGDTARLQKPRDVLLRLRRPHEPCSGLPHEGQAFRGGGRRQVSTDFVSWLISVAKRQRKRDEERTFSLTLPPPPPEQHVVLHYYCWVNLTAVTTTTAGSKQMLTVELFAIPTHRSLCMKIELQICGSRCMCLTHSNKQYFLNHIIPFHSLSHTHTHERSSFKALKWG